MRMILHSLRTWFRRDRTVSARHHRPYIELLEDRVTPSDFRSVIGLGAAQSTYPYRGAGYTVAILDTGIDYNDADLGGGFGTGHRVVAGYNFVNNNSNPMDDNGHGTHLAGIIGSSNASAPGIDPSVNFVALKVLDANMNGSWTAIQNALNWVISHKTQYNIVAVNLSFGSGNYTSNPSNTIESDLATLKAMGVFTVCASGNQYYAYNSQQGLAYPASSPNVVSVGATWAASAAPVTFSSGASESNPTVDHIVSFTQRDSSLSILAPGAWITSDWLNGGTQSMGGTSQATAVVTGAAVLLHEAYDETGQSNLANQSNMLAIMQNTGATIIDVNYGTDNVTHTGLTFKRLNLKAALDAIGQPIAPPTFASIANQTLHVGRTVVVPLNASSPNGSAITYSATAQYLPAIAYQIDQAQHLNYMGNYYLNAYGANEKWMSGAGGVWFGIFPNGQVRRWAGTMAATLGAANLIGTLDASYYAIPSNLWNAPAATAPPAVLSISGNQLSISSSASWLGTYTVVVTASDAHYNIPRTFNITQITNTPPTLVAIANVTISHGQNTNVTLVGADANGDPLTYAATVLSVNGVTPPIQVTIAGNQLTLHATQPLTGTFTISATVSDGLAVATRTFSLTLTNAGPSLAAIGTQTMAAGTTSLAVALPASDPDNDTLTIQAFAQTPNAAAYSLNQQYTFHASNSTYNYNLLGHNEKWLVDKNNIWYCLLPNNKLYKWAGSMTQTLTTPNIIATLDPSIYTEPRLLWNANPATTPALTFTFSGNQLTIHRPTTLTGVFFVNVTVGDGWQTATRTIKVILN
jgi:subtilisin family serine protease